MASPDIFAIDVVVDSVRIDETRETVLIPAVAFRFLSYPMQIVHLVPPEKIPVLQFANESVLLTTLQSDKSVYSFKSGKSCLFDATFEQLEHAFSTSSRLLHIVLLEFYATTVPYVKAMASVDMLPVFEELFKKSKRFLFERPCCAEVSQHVLPIYSRSQLAVCGEIKIDVRFYYLGPKRLAGEDFRANLSSFEFDTSLKSAAESPDIARKLQPLQAGHFVAEPEDLTKRKVFAHNISQVINGFENAEDDFQDNYIPDNRHVVIHEPTRFRCSPLCRNRLEVVSPVVIPTKALPDKSDFCHSDRVTSPLLAAYRRQKDKAVQYAPRSRSKSPTKYASADNRRLYCRHGSSCPSIKCKSTRPLSPSYYPRSASQQECERVKRCYTTTSCEVWQPERRFKGSWKRQVPLAKVKRGITPSPPPAPYWYLGMSRPKYVEKIVEVPVHHPSKSKSRRPVKSHTKMCYDAAVNTDGIALVYSPDGERPKSSPVRIVQESGELTLPTMVEKDKLEDLVAEAMSKFLMKQLQNLNANLQNSSAPTEGVEDKKPPAKMPLKMSHSLTGLPGNYQTIAPTPKRSLASKERRHTVANLAHTFSRGDENDSWEPEIEKAMFGIKTDRLERLSEGTEESERQPSKLGAVPDLPQYIERNRSETPESSKPNIVKSVSTDYEDTFESESVSGGIPSPEPFQRPSGVSLSRRATLDVASLLSSPKSTSNFVLPLTSPVKKPAPSMLRRSTAAELTLPKKSPAFIIGDDGRLISQ